jgi:excisionase family DNA binding protein
VAAQPSGKAAADYPSYLRTAQVADLLSVSPKTVSRWAKEGKLPFLKTLGGHRRYPEAEIRELVEELREEAMTWTGRSSMEGRPVRIEVGRDPSSLLWLEADDRAGKQSSGAIHDDINRCVQALLAELATASVCDSRAMQVASAWLQGHKDIREAPTGPIATPPRGEPDGWPGRLARSFWRKVQAPRPSLDLCCQEGGALDGDPPERRLRAVAPRRAEDRRREDLTDVFRTAWEHGVNGQAQVITGMQQIIHAYTLLQDKEAMSEAVANVRWLIAAGIRDFQAMLDELGKLQTDLPRDAPDEPNHDD